MTLATMSSLNLPTKHLQPQNFAQYLSTKFNYCLFLDIDGTLADFTLKPLDSVIPQLTLTLLQRIQSYGVPIAMVTGRSLAEAQQMISPLQVPIAATHGLEIAFNAVNDLCELNCELNGNQKNIINSDNSGTSNIDISELNTLKQTITQLSQPYPDLSVENKPYSCALHYRQNPTLAEVAYNIMSDTIENYENWTLKQGKYVWEVVPKGVNKGTAILTLLYYIQEKMGESETLCPVFIGDDITDEAGFLAVQGELAFNKEHGLNKQRGLNKTGSEKTGFDNNELSQNPPLLNGMGIKVGREPTHADYYVHDIKEVNALLEAFLSFCQTHYPPSSSVVDATAYIPTENISSDKINTKRII